MLTQLNSVRTVYIMVKNYSNCSKNNALQLFFKSLVSYAVIKVGDLEMN